MGRHILRSAARLLSRLLAREPSGYAFSSVVPMGVPFPVGKLPDGSTYTQALGANQTEETVQISSSAVMRWGAVANLPRVGMAPDGRKGLWRDPPRTCLVLQNRALSNAAWTAGSGVATTENYAAGPDGQTLADRSVVNSGGYSRLSAASIASGSKYTASVWLKHATASGPYKIQFYAGAGAGSSTPNGTATQNWQRVSGTVTASIAVYNMIPADGTNYNGVGPSALDTVSDFPCVELGEYASSAHITGATSAARAGSLHAIPLSGGYLRNGRLRFESDHTPLGAADKYATDGAAIRLWTLDTNNYAEITTATRALTVVVNGVARVAGVAVGWSADTSTHWIWEVGNGSLFVRYRISTDAGVTWGLPFDPFGGTVHTDAALSTVATELHTFSDGVSSKYFGTVEVGWAPLIGAVPAWALQALPTDVASVKAFFRADGGTTLNGSTVSAWGGQTATAVTAFAQGTAAKQPTYEAAGFATARPSLTLDGAGDGMTGPTGASCLTNSEGTIYVLWKPTAFINDSATLYNNDAIVGDTGGAAYGIFGRANTPRFYAYNYDGTVDTSATSAAAVGTTYVLRWRHSGGNIYLRVNGGTESVAVASGNTAALTTISIGFGWDGGRYASGRMGGLVIANAALTVANDAAIMSFLNAYGGIA